MNQFDFHRFWRKNKNIVLTGLFFLFLISYCNQQAPRQTQQPQEQEETASDTLSDSDDRSLKSFEQLMEERRSQQKKRPGGFFTVFLLLMIGVGLVWVARQPWWQRIWRQWFPGRVQFRVSKGKDRVTGRQLLKISIVNKTREGLTFMPPMIVFSKWGKERRFRLRGSDQEKMFPLTLTPGTGHRVVLDLDQFYEKVSDLKGANRVGAGIETTDGKRYKKFALPPWLDLLLK
ncbi:MAG: hypothetical protein R6U46_06195 [Marinilabilia sp.]